MKLDVLDEAIEEGGGGDEEPSNTSEQTDQQTDTSDTDTTSVSTEDDPLSTLDRFDFSKVEETDRSDATSVSDILSRDRETPKGQFTPNVEEFRDYESFFGTNITQGDNLSAEKIDPRFQDLPLMRAKAQGIVESTGRDALKSIPQTATQFAELAGYIGDFQAYDDAFRGLVNYATQKASGEAVMSEDYGDMGNWLSEAARETSTAVDEMLPVYRQDPSKVWAPGDPAWWSTNIANLVETVGAFGGISGAASKGIGYLARGAAKGIGAGARVNTLRGGAKPFKYADYATNAGTTLSTSYGEGMLVGMQNYKRTYQNEKQKLIDRGVSETEADNRAKEAAGQAAATTAGINSVILPFLNFTQAATLTRGSIRSASLTNKALAREGDETFANIGKYADRIKQSDANVNLFSKEAQDLFRESALESAEEMSARISEVEGQYIDDEDAPSAGDRLGEALFSPQSALEATLGAIAGAGQQGIMRSLPTIDDPSGDGRISRRQLEWQRDAEYAAKDKEVLKDRVDDMVEAKSMLAEARELEQEGNQREAQDKRDKATNKIRASLTADNIARGVEGQMAGIYQSIENMDEKQAENMGFDTNPESDQYYKDVAREERNKIEQYTQEYQDLNEQYNFTTQEEFADIPKTLLNLRIQEDNARRRAENIEDEKRRIREEQPADDEFEEQARLDIERERELQNLRKQRDSIQGLRNLFENWSEQSTQDLTMGDIIDNMGAQEMQSRLEEAREALPNELFESIRDLKPQDALDFADYVINKRESQIDEVKNLKTEAYEDFLTMRDMEDSQEARQAFQLMKDQVQQDYKNAYEELDRRQKNAEAASDSVRRRYNYFTSQPGRKQMVDSVKEFFEDVKEKSETEAQAAIMNAETEEEVDNLLDSFPELVSEQIEELGQQRKEEIRGAQMDRQEEGRVDPDSQESEEQAETIADEMESEAEDAVERGEQQQEQEEQGAEEDVGDSFVDTVRDNVPGLSTDEDTQTEEVTDEGDQFTEEVEEKMETAPTQSLINTLREGVNRYVDNREFEDEADVKKRIKDFINQKVSNRDTLKRILNNNEDLRDSLVRQAVDRFQTNKSMQEVKDEATGEVDPTDRPPETVTEDRDDFESEEATEADEGRKLVESGSSVTYFSDNYLNEDVRKDEIEYPQIESSKVMLPGDRVEYRVLTRQEAENEGFNEEDLDNAVFREDISDINNQNIENSVIGVYHDGNLTGYLRRTDSINEDTTATDIENVADNIQKNKSLNRGIRKTVLKQLVEEGNTTVPGKVTKKWAGHLTINRNENGNREMQKMSEGFPGDVTFFVTRYGEPDTGNNGPSISKKNLMNNDEFFERNEGAAGIIVTMGNGNRMAVPIWLPRLGEIDADGDTIVDTLYEIGNQQGGEITSGDNRIDLSDPDAVEQQISRYVYTTSASIYDLLQSEGKRDVHVISSDSGVAVVNQRTDEVYHTNDTLVGNNTGFESWTQNEERVKELLSQMRLNVDLDNINQQKDPGDFPEIVLRADENGNLRVEEYQTYNDLIKQYAETDLDASYQLEGPEGTEYLAYQRPTVNTEPAIGEDTDDANPDIPENTGNTSGPSESTNRSTESAEDVAEESEVEGDTKDVRSTDVDQNTDYDEMAFEIAEQVDEQDITVDEFIENNEGEVIASTAKDLRDQIESVLEEEMTDITDNVESRFEDINTRTDQDTDSLNESIESLNELENELEEEGITLENDLYNEIQQKRSKLEDELVSRGENVDNRSSDSINEDLTDDIEKGLGFNQQDLSQNTYTQEGVLQKDVNGGEQNISEDIIQDQIEEDIADGKLNIRCKT